MARIISFDKFRYQQEKKERKSKTSTKEDIKQVQISIRSAQNDLLIKADKANKFLEKGPVRIVVTLRGREKANKEFAKEKLKNFLNLLVEHKIVMEARPGGRGLITMIQKIK